VILTVAGLKGGVGKTTTAAGLLHALYDDVAGYAVGLDADPQGSLLEWARWGEWTVPVEKFTRPRAEQFTAAGWHAVVDTAPYDQGSVADAVKVADVIVLPVAPLPADVRQLGAARDLLDRHARPDARRVVVLVRTVSGAASTADYRAHLESSGWDVVRPVVSRREAIGHAYGAALPPAVTGPYSDVLHAITKELR
jgi:chromosome partitioning protein